MFSEDGFMPNHCQLPNKSEVRRLRGVRIQSQADRSVLRFGSFSKGWPVIAKRFVSLGFDATPKLNGTRLELLTNASFDEAVSVVSGRRRVSNSRPFLLASVVLGTLLLLALASAVSGSQAKTVKPRPNIDQCSPQSISLALQSVAAKTHVNVDKEYVIGGVKVGTLTCKGSRYSYALELNESKRVLKLEKLDS